MDLSPVWSEPRVGLPTVSGCGGRGVGDIIEFASGIFAYNWRAVSGHGAFNDPDFLVVGCPTDRPCEGWSQKGQTPLTDIEQRTQFSMWCEFLLWSYVATSCHRLLIPNHCYSLYP
jgi:hypothetical protein|eukprot:SAG25_NODE_427_length_8159_cov_9.134491_11_plen_116_part_00